MVPFDYAIAAVSVLEWQRGKKGEMEQGRLKDEGMKE